MTENGSSTANIERQLAEQGFYVSTTVGCSMRPMLRNRRDRVIVLPVGEERLKKYDLPLYRRPDGKYILHRIIGVRDGEYIIRGDNTYVREHVRDAWIFGILPRGEAHPFRFPRLPFLRAGVEFSLSRPLPLPPLPHLCFPRVA